ncbi:MAG: chorismate mutase [Patescibacteria group bacterium]
MTRASRTSEQEERLAELRKMIEIFDRDFIQTLGQRLEVCREIGRFKKKEGVAVKDSVREAALASLHAEWAAEFNVDPQVVEEIFTLVVNESRKGQELV